MDESCGHLVATGCYHQVLQRPLVTRSYHTGPSRSVVLCQPVDQCKTPVVSARVTKQQRQQIENVAYSEHVSVSKWIAAAVQAALERSNGNGS